MASEAFRDRLLYGMDQTHRARLLAVCQPHTAAWLQAKPGSSLGLLLDSETVRIAVALRLGAPIREPHICRLSVDAMLNVSGITRFPTKRAPAAFLASLIPGK